MQDMIFASMEKEQLELERQLFVAAANVSLRRNHESSNPGAK